MHFKRCERLSNWSQNGHIGEILKLYLQMMSFVYAAPGLLDHVQKLLFRVARLTEQPSECEKGV